MRRKRIVRRLASLVSVLALASCGPSRPTPGQLDRTFDKAVTSPIPGAHAVLFAAPGGAAGQGAATVAACVTDAGYCALPAAHPAGLDCLCDTGSFSYGGRTAMPPKTIEP